MLLYKTPGAKKASTPDEVPNDETLAAFEEIENGGGVVYDGSTHDIFASVLSE